MKDFKKTISFLKTAVFAAAIFVFCLSRMLTANGQQTKLILSLDECVKFAARNSFEVKLAKLDLYIEETDLMYSEAVFDTFLYGGAAYEEDKSRQLSILAPNDNQTNEYYLRLEKTLPTGTELCLEAKDTRRWSNSAYVLKNPSHETKITFEAVQPIAKNSFGFVDRTEISITELTVKNAGLETKDRIEALMAKVQTYYWELVSAKRSLEIYEEMLKKAENLFESDKKNLDMGLIEKGELFASEANVAKLKSERVVEENAYRRAQENLKMIMNMNEDIILFPREALNYDSLNKDLTDCLKQAFSGRMDYKIKKREIEIKGLNLKIKDNQQWPEIDLNATLALNGIDSGLDRAVDKASALSNTYYYGGIEFKVPLENKEARSEYVKAGHEKEKALVSFKELERIIITDVGNAFRDVKSFEAGIGFITEAVDLQSKKLEEEEKRFYQARSGTKRLIDYQQDLLGAKLEEALFLFKHKKAKVELDRVMNAIFTKYEDVL
ncbi:MAG: TolC family protein [Candidatus Omnitrophota bacterium]